MVLEHRPSTSTSFNFLFLRLFRRASFWVGAVSAPALVWASFQLYWQHYIRTPEYSLQKLGEAIESRNTSLIEKYVDLDATIVSVAQFYRQTRQGNQENWVWVEKNPAEVRTQIMQGFQDSTIPALDFDAVRQNFLYIHRTQNVAVIGWEWNRNSLQRQLGDNVQTSPSVIELCMEDKGAYWQLKGVCNFLPASLPSKP